MKKSIVCLMILGAAVCKPKKSPEERMAELVPKVIDVTCNMMIDCGKKELSNIPENMRNLIPDYMQSKEKCVVFFTEKQKQSEKNSASKDQKKITEEEIQAAETCIKGMATVKCETIKTGQGLASIPGCSALQKIMQ